jgi:hypothetical protein
MIGSRGRIVCTRGRQSKRCFEQPSISVVANALRRGSIEKQKTPQHNVAAFQFLMTQRG